MMGETSVGHRPDGKWTFDGDVTECFDDMLERSIPQYRVMRGTVTRLARRFRQHKTDIVDLGASRGEAAAPLVDSFGATNRFHLVEVSQPMLSVLRERFRGLIECGVVNVLDLDLRTDFPAVQASVVLSVLTLQFVPLEHRQRVLRDAFGCLLPGGALIIVEKVLGDTARLDEVLVEEYLDHKRRNGYSEDDIQRKRLSLEGVLVPLTAQWNETMLRRCGFDEVECFWRWMNFCGWVAIR